MGPNLFMDTSLFARQTDMEQWKNGFGISFVSARGALETDGAFRIWDWAYGGLPPNSNANVLERRDAADGVPGHPAGRARADARDVPRRPVPVPALRRRADPGRGVARRPRHLAGRRTSVAATTPPSSGSTRPLSGEDEVGNEGVGLYRYANGGQRYTLGNFPDSVEEAGLFDNASSVTIFDQVPAEDDTPDYLLPE